MKKTDNKKNQRWLFIFPCFLSNEATFVNPLGLTKIGTEKLSLTQSFDIGKVSIPSMIAEFMVPTPRNPNLGPTLKSQSNDIFSQMEYWFIQWYHVSLF